jgi:Peroxiredoxin
VTIVDTFLRGLTARAIVIIDEHDKVIYTQLVGEIAHEPDYESALAVL